MLSHSRVRIAAVGRLDGVDHTRAQGVYRPGIVNVLPAERGQLMDVAEEQIRALVDAETAAWTARDASALAALFHPDTVWPWPPNPAAHDPVQWVMPLGRYDRDRWIRTWQELFDSHDLVHNRRRTVRVVVSEQADGGFAVVDVDTLWRNRRTSDPFHWKGRACKVYTKVGARWLFLFQTGLLEY